VALLRTVINDVFVRSASTPRANAILCERDKTDNEPAYVIRCRKKRELASPIAKAPMMKPQEAAA
jgi:hypothetical protein